MDATGKQSSSKLSAWQLVQGWAIILVAAGLVFWFWAANYGDPYGSGGNSAPTYDCSSRPTAPPGQVVDVEVQGDWDLACVPGLADQVAKQMEDGDGGYEPEPNPLDDCPAGARTC